MAKLGYEDKWEILTGPPIGEGGQGIVHKAIDLSKTQPLLQLMQPYHSLLRDLTNVSGRSHEMDLQLHTQLYRTMRSIFDREDRSNIVALKVLHRPADARDPKTMDERLRREIAAMRTLTHRHISPIIDASESEKWYVTPYYQRGSLDKHLVNYKGQLLLTLRAFRGVVAAAAEIESKGMVHRDIKPKNILVDDDGSLILADFGLIYFADKSHTRISETMENVGSWEWMPPWAANKRIEDLDSSFDVFCLGKVLWAMLSGKQALDFWFFDYPENDLTKLFPAIPEMAMVNALLAQCVVEKRVNCLHSTLELLDKIDVLIARIERGGSLLNRDVVRRCNVCGIGQYDVTCRGNQEDRGGWEKYGVRPTGASSYKICACNHCGHVQFFIRDIYNEMPAWKPTTG